VRLPHSPCGHPEDRANVSRGHVELRDAAHDSELLTQLIVVDEMGKIFGIFVVVKGLSDLLALGGLRCFSALRSRYFRFCFTSGNERAKRAYKKTEANWSDKSLPCIPQPSSLLGTSKVSGRQEDPSIVCFRVLHCVSECSRVLRVFQGVPECCKLFQSQCSTV